VANLVPPCVEAPTHHGTSSAIEYAVKGLQVENIIVMGHANCGGINALWSSENQNDSQFIHRWVSIAQPAKAWVQAHHEDVSEAEQLRYCEQRAILVSLDNLLSFEFVRERVEAGTLTLYGWFFDLEEGNLYSYNADKKAFELIDA
jgi:carbonic anhydrase